ncbi:MAG: hypothetical protein E7B57_12020, partial [Staphylococcus epidermidis]|nr:hypothetical protein [Staphylococcus epidermidis]
MKHQNQPLTTIQFYKNTTSLDTSSYSRFTISVFQDVPKWFWGYIIVISLFFTFVMGNDSFFIPISAPPIIQQLAHVYTFIVILLLPMALTYIRFVKSFSFTSLYMKLARTDSKLTERHNRHVRSEKNKVYSDDHYHFTYNRRSSRWHGQNVDAERRNRRSEWGDMAWFIRLGYPGCLFFF